MIKKKILFVTQRDFYPFFVGGAEISAHTLLSYLVSRGHQCLALGTLGKNLGDIKTYIKQFNRQSVPYKFISKTLKLNKYKIPKDLYLDLNVGYDIKLTLLYNFAKFFLEHASEYKPDLVITQMMGSGLAVRFSYENKIPCAHLIRDVNTLYNLEPLFLEPRYDGYPDFFSNSKFVKKEFRRKHKRGSLILYPTININDYKLDVWNGKYITFINPNTKKGVEIFYKVVNQLPEYKFLVIGGWEKIAKNSPLRGLRNITIRPRQFNMKSVYEETKLLLVPSIWEEAFARVVVEAQAGGVPVIAGAHSGLVESVGKGGILIKNYINHSIWTQSIRKVLSNKDLYETLSGKAKRNAEKFDLSKTTTEFCKLYGL